MRYIVSIALVFAFLFSTLPFVDSASSNETITFVCETRNGNTLTVDINGTAMYTSIQDAINASSDGDTILVYPGIYNETLRINTSITLDKYSDIKPIYLGKNYSMEINEFEIYADNVTIQNFTFKGMGAGVRFIEVNNSLLQYSDFYFCNLGVFFYKNNNSICRYNTFKHGNSGFASAISENFCYIYDNTINHSRNAIVLDGWRYSNYNKVSNIEVNNTYNAVKFHGNNVAYISNIWANNCDEVIQDLGYMYGEYYIENITGCNSNIGVDVTMDHDAQTKNIFHIKNSKFINMKFAGFYFEECQTTRIVENCSVENARYGLFTERCTGRLYIEKANFTNIDNGTYFLGNEKVDVSFSRISSCDFIGFRIQGKNIQCYSNIVEDCYQGVNINDISENNKFYNNYFINNTVQVNDQGTNTRWYTDYPIGGNYWSDYVGTDIMKGYSQDEPGSDGFGDTSYIIGPGKYDLYPIFIDNENPVAVAPEDISFNEGTIYHFDSSSSTDDQLIHRAVWSFEYDNQIKEIDNLEFDFAFDIPGIYNVDLTVYDYGGNSDTDTMTITVIDIYDPVAISQGDLEIAKDTTAIFNGSASHDSSGIKEYHWYFDFDGEDIHLTGPNPEFTFTKTGIFQVTLKVIDNYDHFGETIFNVSVPDTIKPIVDAGTDIIIDNGDIAEFDGSNTIDDSGISNYTWSFTYNSIFTSVEGISPTFQFDIPGVYIVTLTVIDVFGNVGDDTLTVTVRDTIPPVAKISGSKTILEGEICNLDGTTSTDNGEIVRYVWSFTDDKLYNFEEEKLQYDFKVKGYHNITLTVWDEFDLSDNTWVIVEIVDTTNPIANAGPDTTIGAGSTFMFNASKSADDGRIVKWEWDFEYDGIQSELEGETAAFTFDIAGEYTILLTVYDQSDNLADDQILITVVDTGTLTGIVKDTEGNTLKSAKIQVTDANGINHETSTDSDGLFSIDIPMGTVSWTISKDGYKSISGTAEISPLETTTLDLSDKGLEKEDRSAGGILLVVVIGIILLVIVIIILIYVFIIKGRQNNKQQYDDEEQEEVERNEEPEMLPELHDSPTFNETIEEGQLMEEPAVGDIHGLDQIKTDEIQILNLEYPSEFDSDVDFPDDISVGINGDSQSDEELPSFGLE